MLSGAFSFRWSLTYQPDQQVSVEINRASRGSALGLEVGGAGLILATVANILCYVSAWCCNCSIIKCCQHLLSAVLLPRPFLFASGPSGLYRETSAKYHQPDCRVKLSADFAGMLSCNMALAFPTRFGITSGKYQRKLRE